MCGGEDCGGIRKGSRSSPKGVLGAVIIKRLFPYHFFIKKSCVRREERDGATI